MKKVINKKNQPDTLESIDVYFLLIRFSNKILLMTIINFLYFSVKVKPVIIDTEN